VVFFTQKEDPTMAGRRGHTEEQILAALRHAESGTTVTEICRDVGISEQKFYVWKRKYAGLGLSELRELRQLREAHERTDNPTLNTVARCCCTVTLLFCNADFFIS
jgi:putative transposase